MTASGRDGASSSRSRSQRRDSASGAIGSKVLAITSGWCCQRRRSYVRTSQRVTHSGSHPLINREEIHTMSALVGALRPIPFPQKTALRSNPAAQAFTLMRITFTVAPIVFGLDKFANVLTDDWTLYLSSQFNDVIPWSAATDMHIVGVVEIVAGLVVAVAPRFGGLLVAAWLGGIIVNLLLVGGYGDIAMRDFGLLLGALALSRLASAFAPPLRR